MHLPTITREREDTRMYDPRWGGTTGSGGPRKDRRGDVRGERELIRELFDSLEVAHSHLASACSVLSQLSSTLKPTQLMTILEASIRPLVQIKTTSAFKLRDVPEKRSELPDDPEERVKLLMIPNPAANTIKDEKINSPTRLLAATWAHRISNIFGKGTTQWKIQESYGVRAKQLAACIMGRKYLGGADRKRRLTGTDAGPSSSKKPRPHWPQHSKRYNKHIKSHQHHL